MYRRLALIAALLSVSLGAANAETVAQTFEKFGMIGTWAENCKAPASDSNLYQEYSILPSGLVARRFFNGPRANFEYNVLSAEVSGDQITLDVRNLEPPYRGYGIVMIKRGDKIRLWESANEYDHSQVLDGAAVDTRVATSWLSRCR